ncbi:MAG: type II toxin-antitoxin system RelE/ParE family toxin [Clostridia bacterium]|nr:type II toxin-antitoxin system RelE/ParE family toxin [Clostridia bacterium]
MEYKLIYTDHFYEYLREVMLYIANKYSHEIAEEKINKIGQDINLLKQYPYLGRIPKFREDRRRGYRALVLEKNIVFYSVDEEDKTITLHIITDYRTDYISLFEE